MKNKNIGFFFSRASNRYSTLSLRERRRCFYLRQMFLMYIAHIHCEDFDTTEFENMKLPPVKKVLGFAIEDIICTEHIPTYLSPASTPSTHLFFELRNGRRVYQYDNNIEIAPREDDFLDE